MGQLMYLKDLNLNIDDEINRRAVYNSAVTADIMNGFLSKEDTDYKLTNQNDIIKDYFRDIDNYQNIDDSLFNFEIDNNMYLYFIAKNKVDCDYKIRAKLPEINNTNFDELKKLDDVLIKLFENNLGQLYEIIVMMSKIFDNFNFIINTKDEFDSMHCETVELKNEIRNSNFNYNEIIIFLQSYDHPIEFIYSFLKRITDEI